MEICEDGIMDKKTKKRFECNEQHIIQQNKWIQSFRISRIIFFIMFIIGIVMLIYCINQVYLLEKQLLNGEWECVNMSNEGYIDYGEDYIYGDEQIFFLCKKYQYVRYIQ